MFQEIKFRTSKKNVPHLPQIIENVPEIKLPSLFYSAVQKLDQAFAALMPTDGAKLAHRQLDVQKATQAIESMAADDKEIRLKILSFVQWFGPILKGDLTNMLHERQVPTDHIAINLDRLAAAQMIKDTGSHYLPGDDGICAAIGLSRIDELADMLRGG